MSNYQVFVVIIVNVMIILFVTTPALLHIYKMIFWTNASGTVKKIEMIGSGETEILTPVVLYIFNETEYEISYRGLIGRDKFEVDKSIDIKVKNKSPRKFVISNWSVGAITLICALAIHVATLKLLAHY